MMTTSCPGFLDRHGIWNNGFDCSSPRVCCGTEIDRYCCTPSKTSSSSLSSTLSSFHSVYQSANDFVYSPSDRIFSEKWILFQICIIGLFLTIVSLMVVMICQCLTTTNRNRRRKQQRMSIVQMPLPSSSPLLFGRGRPTSNRMSTISSTPSDTKSQCTDTSIVFNTPLNIYPASNNRSSTSSSSYYLFPSELEHLCK